MSSDKRKTEKMNDKYSKKIKGSDSKFDLSSTFMSSLYRFHELTMK